MCICTFVANEIRNVVVKKIFLFSDCDWIFVYLIKRIFMLNATVIVCLCMFVFVVCMSLRMCVRVYVFGCVCGHACGFRFRIKEQEENANNIHLTNHNSSDRQSFLSRQSDSLSPPPPPPRLPSPLCLSHLPRH